MRKQELPNRPTIQITSILPGWHTGLGITGIVVGLGLLITNLVMATDSAIAASRWQIGSAWQLGVLLGLLLIILGLIAVNASVGRSWMIYAQSLESQMREQETYQSARSNSDA